MGQHKKKSKSSVRHTRAIQRDRRKRPVSAPPDGEIEARMRELLQPALAQQAGLCASLGLRSRLLTLPVMVAIVISLIWRQLGGGGSEIARLLATEGLLWVPVLVVSQQAISQRLRLFPPLVFLHLLNAVLPVVNERSRLRQRPLPAILAWAQVRYRTIVAVDGSALDALVRKVGLVRGAEQHPLAGKMFAVLDVCSWLPTTLWYVEETHAHDQRFWPALAQVLPQRTLLLLDAGFTNFAYFLRLTHLTFIIPAKTNLACDYHQCLQFTPCVHDFLVYVAQGAERHCLRLVKVYYHQQWYAYLTNELDPRRLPPDRLAALYWQRWRIEDAFEIVKRLLGLAYFWTGSLYGILLQLWTTWLLYAILIDLTDDVAAALDRPLADISPEMVYRSLYYFAQAYQRGQASDPVAFLAAHARLFGLIKRRRKRAFDHSADLTFLFDP
jgi:hypothetical protein